MKKSKVLINLIYQTVYQVLAVITPLITAPYIARVLGPDNNGIYTYTFSIVNYFVVFASLGIEAYGNRLVAQAKSKGKSTLDYAFCSVFWMHFIVAVIAVALYLVYAFLFAGEYRTIALYQSIWVISALIDVNWLFFGLEEFRITVIRNLAIKLLTVVSIFVFVNNKTDLNVYTLVMGLGTLISNSFLWIIIKRYVSFKRVLWKDIIKHLKPLSILFVAVVATSIYRMIDKVMLGWFSDMSSLGSYEYADKMIKLVITIITALGTVMLPRMSALYAEGKDKEAARYMKSTSQFIFVISFALAFGLAGISNEFMPLLLGPGYDGSVVLTKVLCISLPIMGWNNLIRTQVLMPKEKDRVYTIAVWVGAIVNILLNFILINLFGPIGAAVATVIAYGIVGVFQTYPIRKEYSIMLYMKYIPVPLFSGLIMYIFIRVLSSVLNGGAISVVIESLSGAVIYIIINTIYLVRSNNEVMNKYLYKIKKKL